jgi:hypothetical protein
MKEQEPVSQKPQQTCDQSHSCSLFSKNIVSYALGDDGKLYPAICDPKCPNHPEFDFSEYEEVPPSG